LASLADDASSPRVSFIRSADQSNLDVGIIKVTITNDFLYKFELCGTENDQNCRMLGRRRAGYSYYELEQARNIKLVKAVVTNVADVAVLAVAAAAGFAYPMIYVGGGATGGIAGVLGAAVGPALVLTVEFLSPTKRWREARTISNDKLIQIQIADIYIDKPIVVFAHDLSNMLKQLD
jgi:hypothetical protein